MRDFTYANEHGYDSFWKRPHSRRAKQPLGPLRKLPIAPVAEGSARRLNCWTFLKCDPGKDS